MNNKILIASLFATLMLLVPMTSVVGVSDVEEDCGCQPISNQQSIRIERLQSKLESRINFILLRYGDIPEIAEKCEEVLELINSDGLWDIICDAINGIINFMVELREKLPYALWVIINIPLLFLAVFWIMYCFEPVD